MALCLLLCSEKQILHTSSQDFSDFGRKSSFTELLFDEKSDSNIPSALRKIIKRKLFFVYINHSKCRSASDKNQRSCLDQTASNELIAERNLPREDLI